MSTSTTHRAMWHRARGQARRQRPVVVVAGGVVAAAVAVAGLYLVGAGYLGSAAYIGMGVVLLAVALVLGARAWLASLVLAGALIASYLALAIPVLTWDEGQQQELPPLVVDLPDEPGLVRLRAEYQLDHVVAGAADDYVALQRIVQWANGRFGHSADNQPTHPDPLTILAEAAQGARFRCVEYAIVTAATARALGLPARIVSLHQAEVETLRYGSTHVVAEVWLASRQKWVMADAQTATIPERDGVPLSAVELQAALAHHAPGLRFVPAGSLPLRDQVYALWVAPYLVYFDTAVDQRLFVEPAARIPGRVLLVPAGWRVPRTFGGRLPIADSVAISNPRLFYAPPGRETTRANGTFRIGQADGTL